ncbi:MAG TPA: hypothetical protein VG052_01895 [Puia sp.]|nr:hypothetical protein [Puia sp.]
MAISPNNKYGYSAFPIRGGKRNPLQEGFYEGGMGRIHGERVGIHAERVER